MPAAPRTFDRRHSNHATKGVGRPSIGLITLAVLLVAAMLLGGGGVRYALSNLSVQLIALGVLAISYEACVAFWRSAPGSVRLLVAASLLLPLLQLVPLPQGIWSALPGRELVRQSFELTGRSGFAPLSVDPIRTLVAWTALVTPFAMLCGGWKAPRSHLVVIGWLIVALGLINVLVSFPQILGSGKSLFYSDLDSRGILSGTFANRNTTGLFLVGAMILTVTLPRPKGSPAELPVLLAITAVLFTGVILTQSRTALALTTIPIGLAALFLWSWLRKAGKVAGFSSPVILIGVAGLAAAGATATLVAAPGRVSTTLERFQSIDDARQYTWEDASYSVSRYWPAGAGMGSFDEVFQIDESLENATVKRPGRAHNDYIEIAIEAGLAGVLITTLWFALVIALSFKARKSPLKWSAWGSAAFLFAIALQSITDYPLRNQSMLAVASFALLLLTRIATEPPEGARK